jgi:creatinine amidohydrolase/Fe(II)-dependent formamide hydrolase-like protein
MTSYHDPASRRLELLTSPEIAAIDKSDALVLQPIASIEQHGAHLPCATDTILAEAMTDRALARTPTGANVWRLPVISYGKSTEHLGYPGTITLSTETLLAVCNDVGRSVAASGFRKLAFVNGHGGQPQLLEVVARDIRERTGLMVFPLFPPRLGIPDGVVSSPAEARYGIHGGEIETSEVLAVAPHLVRNEHLVPGSTRVRELYDDKEFLSLEGSLPTAWLTRDLAPAGVLGDPTLATAEKGERVLTHIAERLAGALAEICALEFDIGALS